MFVDEIKIKFRSSIELLANYESIADAVGFHIRYGEVYVYNKEKPTEKAQIIERVAIREWVSSHFKSGFRQSFHEVSGYSRADRHGRTHLKKVSHLYWSHYSSIMSEITIEEARRRFNIADDRIRFNNRG